MFSTGCTTIPFYNKNAKDSQSLQISREGITAYEHKEYAEAEKKLEEAIDLNPNDIEANRYYAETLWERGEKEKALDILRSTIQKKGTQDQEAILNQSLGEKYLILRQPQAAAECAEQIIALLPKKHEGWVIRATARWQLGQQEDALCDYQKALSCSPDNRDILWQTAILQSAMNRNDRALAVWQHLARLYPVGTVPAEVLYGRANAYYQMKRPENASEDLQKAIAESPDRKEFYQLLSKVQLEQGKIQSALASAARAVNCAPNDADVLTFYRQIEQLQIAAQQPNSNRF